MTKEWLLSQNYSAENKNEIKKRNIPIQLNN